jgi:hypothetical protein
MCNAAYMSCMQVYGGSSDLNFARGTGLIVKDRSEFVMWPSRVVSLGAAEGCCNGRTVITLDV